VCQGGLRSSYKDTLTLYNMGNWQKVFPNIERTSLGKECQCDITEKDRERQREIERERERERAGEGRIEMTIRMRMRTKTGIEMGMRMTMRIDLMFMKRVFLTKCWSCRDPFLDHVCSSDHRSRSSEKVIVSVLSDYSSILNRWINSLPQEIRKERKIGIYQV